MSENIDKKHKQVREQIAAINSKEREFIKEVNDGSQSYYQGLMLIFKQAFELSTGLDRVDNSIKKDLSLPDLQIDRHSILQFSTRMARLETQVLIVNQSKALTQEEKTKIIDLLIRKEFEGYRHEKSNK